MKYSITKPRLISGKRAEEWGEKRLFRNAACQGSGIVYFAQPGDLPKVKIGFSHGNLAGRIESFQTGCWEEIRVIGVIINASYRLETEIHRRFKAFNIRREWFELVPEIQGFIDRNKTDRRWDDFGNWLDVAATPELRKLAKGAA